MMDGNCSLVQHIVINHLLEGVGDFVRRQLGSRAYCADIL